MLSDDQITAGQARLTNAGTLTAGDQSDLLAAFRLWLGSRASEYTDVAVALASATSPTAERLAGALILLQELNFSVSSLSGGRLGLKDSDEDERNLLIRYAFGLLFELPPEITTGLPGSFNAETWVNF